MRYVSNLKHGETIIFVSDKKVRQLKYLCPHPRKELHHILLDENEEPIRVYTEKLQWYLNQNINSYKEAELYIAHLVIKEAQKIIDEYNQKPKDTRTILVKTVEDFIYECGEDYNLWDEDTQGVYPPTRLIKAMENFLKSIK